MVPVKVPLLLNSTLHSCLATTSDVLSRDFRFTAIRDYLLLMMPIELPDDVFLVIFLHLHWKEIRQMRLTCRKCHRLTKQKSLWQRLLQTQILDNNVPVPGLRGLSLENGTSEELELLVINAQELRRKWTSPSPVPKRTSHLQAPNSSRVIRLHFLKIPDRKWLLSLSAKVDPGHRRFWLQLWDLAQYPPISIATQEIHNLNSMAVNEVHDASGVVAIHAMSSPKDDSVLLSLHRYRSPLQEFICFREPRYYPAMTMNGFIGGTWKGRKSPCSLEI
ncbi:hypothetical protein CC1G_00816 [Coprinopsis cinerea okayama7|uniref:F-box domain-containing protein n=1 Tax=Coprinopsis cinerea (strain Okayama-7 / 130 / ATCC MYA-4618 / FGSC 9003) TaxID=240176 RepID=A8N8U1_COPC7|nr:hypothetical protein CC1G_00816 [Coprinopsis cinerea okayama7\|eukprot:XP_001831269.2 hypothetical protein CC1G_00816 [Coprinopsis cinerea okayama7\